MILQNKVEETGEREETRDKLNKFAVRSVLVSSWAEPESIDVTESQQQHAVKPTGLTVWRVATAGVFRPLGSCRMMNLTAYYTSQLARTQPSLVECPSLDCHVLLVGSWLCS